MGPGYYGEDLPAEDDEGSRDDDGPLWTVEEEAWHDKQDRKNVDGDYSF